MLVDHWFTSHLNLLIKSPFADFKCSFTEFCESIFVKEDVGSLYHKMNRIAESCLLVYSYIYVVICLCSINSRTVLKFILQLMLNSMGFGFTGDTVKAEKMELVQWKQWVGLWGFSKFCFCFLFFFIFFFY